MTALVAFYSSSIGRYTIFTPQKKKKRRKKKSGTGCRTKARERARARGKCCQGSPGQKKELRLRLRCSHATLYSYEAHL